MAAKRGGDFKYRKMGTNIVGGKYSEVRANGSTLQQTGATLRQAQGPPPPTQVKFTVFPDRSRILNVYKRIETFVNVYKRFIYG